MKQSEMFREKMEKYSQVTEICNKDTLLHYRPHKKMKSPAP